MTSERVQFSCSCGSLREVRLRAEDKKAEYCNSCGRLWDVMWDGEELHVKRSPLPRGTEVQETGVRYINGARPTINAD